MCKILVIPKITKETAKLAWKFAIAVTPRLTEEDDHGFGYMALGEKGLFGERWLRVSDAWKSRPKDGESDTSFFGDLLAALATPKKGYNVFGESDNKPTAIVLHARFGTHGTRSLECVHPFVTKDGKTGLVHNGSVSDYKLKAPSGCDSEGIMNAYDKIDVASSANIDKLADKLSGSYACAAISKGKDGWVLDVFREETSVLGAVYVPKLGTTVFCTDLSIVAATLKRLGWEVGARMYLKKNTFVRFDAKSGKLKFTKAFASESSKTYWYGSAEKSRYTSFDDAIKKRSKKGRKHRQGKHEEVDHLHASQGFGHSEQQDEASRRAAGDFDQNGDPVAVDERLAS